MRTSLSKPSERKSYKSLCLACGADSKGLSVEYAFLKVHVNTCKSCGAEKHTIVQTKEVPLSRLLEYTALYKSRQVNKPRKIGGLIIEFLDRKLDSLYKNRKAAFKERLGRQEALKERQVIEREAKNGYE